MPLQNRVTPFSEIERSPVRGLFTGNRGCLHGEAQNLLSEGWKTKAWIICALEYRGQRRKLMTPGHWTELFFLDEAVALAAGHRPCALCRRPEYRRFMAATGHKSAPDLDSALHQERVARIRNNHRTMIDSGRVPNGAFIAVDGRAFLKSGGSFREWSHDGYLSNACVIASEVELLTPLTSIRALENGYSPVLHSSFDQIPAMPEA